MSTSAWLLSTSRAEVPGVSSLPDPVHHVVVDPDAAEPVRDGADRSTRRRTADRPEDDQPDQAAQDRPGARGLGGVVSQASDARLLGAGHPDHGRRRRAPSEPCFSCRLLHAAAPRRRLRGVWGSATPSGLAPTVIPVHASASRPSVGEDLAERGLLLVVQVGEDELGLLVPAKASRTLSTTASERQHEQRRRARRHLVAHLVDEARRRSRRRPAIRRAHRWRRRRGAEQRHEEDQPEEQPPEGAAERTGAGGAGELASLGLLLADLPRRRSRRRGGRSSSCCERSRSLLGRSAPPVDSNFHTVSVAMRAPSSRAVAPAQVWRRCDPPASPGTGERVGRAAARAASIVGASAAHRRLRCLEHVADLPDVVAPARTPPRCVAGPPQLDQHARRGDVDGGGRLPVQHDQSRYPCRSAASALTRVRTKSAFANISGASTRTTRTPGSRA